MTNSIYLVNSLECYVEKDWGLVPYLVGKSAVMIFLIIIYMFAFDLGEDISAILVVGKERRETNTYLVCILCTKWQARYFLDIFFIYRLY